MFVLLIIYFLPILVLAWVLWLWLGKRIVRTSRAAILAIAIPQALLAITLIVLYLLTLGDADMRALHDLWAPCFYASLGISTAAFLSSVVFAIGREWEIAKGTGFGSGIGFVVFVPAFVAAFVLFEGWV